MMNKNSFILLGLMMSVSGCVSYKTQNAVVTSKQLPMISKLCIQENLVIDPTKQYLNIIVNRFEKNGIKTQIYGQQKPSECQYTLTYAIKKNWDMISFISKADLRLFDKGLQIHTAQYKVNSTFELDKWKSANDKLEPLVDQLSLKQ